jgi:hypothetical protein
MEFIDEFSNTHVDLDDEENREPMTEIEMKMTYDFSEYMVGNKFLQIKNNFISKGLVPLEKLFNRNDVPINPTVLPKDGNAKECNIR